MRCRPTGLGILRLSLLPALPPMAFLMTASDVPIGLFLLLAHAQKAPGSVAQQLVNLHLDLVHVGMKHLRIGLRKRIAEEHESASRSCP